MDVQLKMVGAYQGKNITIKGVEFKNGVALVRGTDELVPNICKYLRQFGAYPSPEAEQRQAEIDGVPKDIARARANKMEAEKALAVANRQVAQVQADMESSNGAMEDIKASEGSISKSSEDSEDEKSSFKSRRK